MRVHVALLDDRGYGIQIVNDVAMRGADKLGGPVFKEGTLDVSEELVGIDKPGEI